MSSTITARSSTVLEGLACELTGLAAELSDDADRCAQAAARAVRRARPRRGLDRRSRGHGVGDPRPRPGRRHPLRWPARWPPRSPPTAGGAGPRGATPTRPPRVHGGARVTSPATLDRLQVVAGWEPALVRGARAASPPSGERLLAWRARLDALGRELVAGDCWAGPAAEAVASAVEELSGLAASAVAGGVRPVAGGLRARCVAEADAAQELAVRALVVVGPDTQPRHAALAPPGLFPEPLAAGGARPCRGRRRRRASRRRRADGADRPDPGPGSGLPRPASPGPSSSALRRWSPSADGPGRGGMVGQPPRCRSAVAGRDGARAASARWTASPPGPVTGPTACCWNGSSTIRASPRRRRAPVGSWRRGSRPRRRPGAPSSCSCSTWPATAWSWLSATSTPPTPSPCWSPAWAPTPPTTSTPGSATRVTSHGASAAAAPGLAVAVVVWLGYRTPSTLPGIVTRGAAQRGGATLAAALDGLAAARDGHRLRRAAHDRGRPQLRHGGRRRGSRPRQGGWPRTPSCSWAVPGMEDDADAPGGSRGLRRGVPPATRSPGQAGSGCRRGRALFGSTGLPAAPWTGHSRLLRPRRSRPWPRWGRWWPVCGPG